MKTTLKKLASLALALVMVMAMMVPAFADDTATITIKNSLDGEHYDIYKIFDMTVSGDKVAYSIANGWEGFFTTGKGADYLSDDAVDGAALLNVGTATKYLDVNDDNVVDFASDALDYALTTEGLSKTTVDGTGENVTAALSYGYYLTYLRGATDQTAASDGSLCALDNVTKDVTLKIKATLPTIEKTADTNVAGVGEVVNFTIKGQVPDTTNFETYTYKVSDTMTNGLTFNEDVKVTIDGTEITVDPTYADNGFELTLVKDETKNELGTNVGAPIVITYTATVNANAIVKDYDTNSAKLTYSNDPSWNGDGEEPTGDTTPVVVKIFTTSIDVDKYALNASDTEDTSNKLAGAEFALYKMDGETKLYYVKDAEGNVSWIEWNGDLNAENLPTIRTSQEVTGLLDAKFDGLGNDTYYLEETKAPDGYNKLAAAVKVEINVQPETVESTEGAELVSSTTDADGNVTNKYIVKGNLNHVESIQNSTGAELPETGGIGTTIFYTMGALLVVSAGILLVAKKRMACAE